MSDSWPKGPRRFVPVPGVISLDDLEPDDLDAAARADAEEPTSGFPDDPAAPPPPLRTPAP